MFIYWLKWKKWFLKGCEKTRKKYCNVFDHFLPHENLCEHLNEVLYEPLSENFLEKNWKGVRTNNVEFSKKDRFYWVNLEP